LCGSFYLDQRRGRDYDQAQEIAEKLRMANIFRTNPKRLGEFLISAGVVSEEDINKAVAEKKESGGLLGEVLVQMDAASERDIAEVISAQFSIPFIDVDQYDISSEAFSKLDAELMKEHCFIPLDKLGEVLLIAMGGVLSQAVAEKIEKECSCALQVVVSTAGAVRSAIETQVRRSRMGSAPPEEAAQDDKLAGVGEIEEDVEVELLNASGDASEDLAESEDAQIAREIEKQLKELGGDEAAALMQMEQDVQQQIEQAVTEDGDEADTSVSKKDKTTRPAKKSKSARKIHPDDDFFDPSVIKPG